MRSGRVYEVFVNGEPVKLVGSTVRTLKQRRSSGYVKRFGAGVDLRLVREIARPADYSNKDFEFYLRACEAMDIARKGTYDEHGGLNKLSPLVQSLGYPLISEIARLGGRIGSRNQSREDKVRAGRIGGRIGSREGKTLGGRIGGPIGGRIGGRIGGPIGNHIRWHVRRGITNPSCSLCTPKADTIQ